MGHLVSALYPLGGFEGHTHAETSALTGDSHPLFNLAFLFFFFFLIPKAAGGRTLYLPSVHCVWELILGTSWGNESCLWPAEGAAGVHAFCRNRISPWGHFEKLCAWWLSSKRCLLWFILQLACMWSFRFNNDWQKFRWGQRKLLGSGFYFSLKKDMFNKACFL